MPAGVDRTAFVEPQRVSYKAPDGREVPAWLFVPPHLDRTRKHPVVVWIHGDGINQNYDGWHVQRNYSVYYSFHQYLLQRGYIVLAPEYRGSIGYGREWRQAVAYDVGGKDAEDAAASVEYLKSLAYMDPNRIGVWGLSYGGFFTLIGMADHPTAFACGIDVAGSVDYRMWYEDPGGAWVVARMDTPAGRPDVYDKAAVIDRVGKIERPLLILHGTADLNVPYHRVGATHRRSPEGGQEHRVHDVPRRIPLFPARPRVARRMDARRRVLRQTSQAGIEELMRLITVIALVTLASACRNAGAERQTATATPRGGLTIDLLTQIKHPSQATWSPDSHRVAFVWDMGGVQNLYVVDAQASKSPSRVTSYNDGTISDVSWTQDGHGLLFVHAGDLWQISADASEQPTPLWTTAAAENEVVFSPDRTRVAFVRGDDPSVPAWQRGEGDLWVRSLADGSETRLTHSEGVVSSPSWSPDGQHLAFTLTPVGGIRGAGVFGREDSLHAR